MKIVFWVTGISFGFLSCFLLLGNLIFIKKERIDKKLFFSNMFLLVGYALFTFLIVLIERKIIFTSIKLPFLSYFVWGWGNFFITAPLYIIMFNNFLKKIMPIYNYKCNKCEKTFDVRATLVEKEKQDPEKFHCPFCKSSEITQQIVGANFISGSSGNDEGESCCSGGSCACGL